VLGELVPRLSALDIHYVVFNRKERGVALRRCVVIPMPFKEDKPSLRVRAKQAPSVMHTAPPDRTPLEWLKHGLESNRHTTQDWLWDLLLEHNLLKADDKRPCGNDGEATHEVGGCPLFAWSGFGEAVPGAGSGPDG
jgi:hypothetical protein